MMNGTIFLAKQKYEYKHLALYITFTYIKFIYVIALLQDTCILTKHKFLLGGGTLGNSFPLNGKHTKILSWRGKM